MKRQETRTGPPEETLFRSKRDAPARLGLPGDQAVGTAEGEDGEERAARGRAEAVAVAAVAVAPALAWVANSVESNDPAYPCWPVR